MSLQDDNKAIVGRWFTDFWGETCNLRVVDEIAAPDMLLKYSLHEPRKGREDIKARLIPLSQAAQYVVRGDPVRRSSAAGARGH